MPKSVSLKDQFDDYHGLVVVHPDFSMRSRHPDYEKNLFAALTIFSLSRKPIFVAKDEVMSPEAKIWQRIGVVRANVLPIITPPNGMFASVEDFLKQGQSEVDFIIDHIGIEREKIRLAFGGLHADECVYAFATNYCKTVETDYPGDEIQPLVTSPIGFGKVFSTIV